VTNLIEEEYLNISGGRARLRWLAANAVRITLATPGDAPFPPDRPWMEHVFLPVPSTPLEEAQLRIEVLHDRLRAVNQEGVTFFEQVLPAHLGLRRRKPYFGFDIPKTEVSFGVRRVEQGVGLKLAIAHDEAFYGWGEWFNAFRRRSGSLNLRIRDAISLLQGKHTYSTIPMFLSNRGYAFLLLNSHASRWKIDPKRGELGIEADGPGADYVLIYGPSFKRILETYTALTGRPGLPPRWAFGLWVTSYPQGPQAGVLAHLDEHRRRGIPLDAAILDYHWEQGFHNFRWRESLFPDPEGLIDGLKSRGVRLGLIITPFVNLHNRPIQKFLLNALAHNIPHGLERDDERALPEYERAKEKGYLAHQDAKWWFGSGGMVDFSNPEAASWWTDLMRPLYEQGVAFFKNDDGEYLPEGAHSAVGMDGCEYHNLYGFYYGRALYEGMAVLNGDDPAKSRRPLIYARSVWVGSQRYPAIFLGDQKPTFEGIRSTLRAGLNLGLLGFAYWTADVFGLDGKTTPETHMRYAQWALLNPIARYFWRPPEVDATRFPWSHGPKAEANFRQYAQLRYRLLPYYLSLAWESYQTGLPILRPLVLEFQADPGLAGVYDQLMLGKALMLCPVVDAGATTRRMLLPRGVWHDFWSQQSWHGPDEIMYEAPLDRLPILARGGTILPMGPVLQSIPENHRLDDLDLHIWPPFPARGEFYDDDGRTRAYLQGDYSVTLLIAEEEENKIVVRIAPAQGGFPEQVKERHIDLVLHRSTLPQVVFVNNRKTDGWKLKSFRRLSRISNLQVEDV
jgi:alpha-D-xyloside xylohydrolase